MSPETLATALLEQIPLAAFPAFVELADLQEHLGPAGTVLTLLSVYTLALVIWKLAQLAFNRIDDTRPVERVLAALEGEGLEAATRILERSRHPVARVIRAGVRLAAEGRARDFVEAELRDLAVGEIERLSRHNRALELIGLVAPLLGLLGTILGMVEAFRALQSSGVQADPALLAGGIWQALLTTAIGLVVAIPAIVVFNVAENRSDRLRRLMVGALERFMVRIGGGPP